MFRTWMGDCRGTPYAVGTDGLVTQYWFLRTWASLSEIRWLCECWSRKGCQMIGHTRLTCQGCCGAHAWSLTGKICSIEMTHFAGEWHKCPKATKCFDLAHPHRHPTFLETMWNGLDHGHLCYFICAAFPTKPFFLYIFKPVWLTRIFQPQLVLVCWCQYCSQTEALCL
jgi:hypothetical protein